MPTVLFLKCFSLFKPSIARKGAALRDGDVLLFVCLFVRSSVCRLWNIWSSATWQHLTVSGGL